jgi:hypothetical protein
MSCGDREAHPGLKLFEISIYISVHQKVRDHWEDQDVGGWII